MSLCDRLFLCDPKVLSHQGMTIYIIILCVCSLLLNVLICFLIRCFSFICHNWECDFFLTSTTVPFPFMYHKWEFDFGVFFCLMQLSFSCITNSMAIRCISVILLSLALSKAF